MIREREREREQQPQGLPRILQVAHKGSGGQKGWIHHTDGIVGAVTATDYKDPKYILEERGVGVNEKIVKPVISSAQAHATVNDDLSPAITAAAGMGGGQTAMVIEPGINVLGSLGTIGTTSEHNNRVHDPEGISPTATDVAGGTHHIKIFDYSRYRVRKLTPTEYGRLQAFPMDNWKQVVSNSQAYKQFGNAVTVTLAEAIGKSIIGYLDSVGGVTS